MVSFGISNDVRSPEENDMGTSVHASQTCSGRGSGCG